MTSENKFPGPMFIDFIHHLNDYLGFVFYNLMHPQGLLLPFLLNLEFWLKFHDEVPIENENFLQ